MDEKAYENDWVYFTTEWGKEKIAAWHRELEDNPSLPKLRQDELNKDISYMGRMLERIAKEKP